MRGLRFLVVAVLLVAPCVAPPAGAASLVLDGPAKVTLGDEVVYTARQAPFDGLPNRVPNGLMDRNVGGWSLVQSEIGRGASLKYEKQSDGAWAARVDVKAPSRDGGVWLLAILPLDDVTPERMRFSAQYRTSGDPVRVEAVLREGGVPVPGDVANATFADTRVEGAPSSSWAYLDADWVRAAPSSRDVGVHLKLVVAAGASATVWFRSVSLLPPIQLRWMVDGETAAGGVAPAEPSAPEAGGGTRSLLPTDAFERHGTGFWSLGQSEIGRGASVGYERQTDGTWAARIDVAKAQRAGSVWLLGLVPLDAASPQQARFEVEYRTNGSVGYVATVLRENVDSTGGSEPAEHDTRLVGPPSKDWTSLSTTWSRRAESEATLGVHLRFLVAKNATGNVWFRNVGLLPFSPLGAPETPVASASEPQANLSLVFRQEGVHEVLAEGVFPGAGHLVAERRILVADAFPRLCQGADGALYLHGSIDNTSADLVVETAAKAKGPWSAAAKLQLSAPGDVPRAVTPPASNASAARAVAVLADGARIVLSTLELPQKPSLFIHNVSLEPVETRLATGFRLRALTCVGTAEVAMEVRIRGEDLRIPLLEVSPGVWEAELLPEFGTGRARAQVTVVATLPNGTVAKKAVDAKARPEVGNTEFAKAVGTTLVLSAAFAVAGVWTAWDYRRGRP